VSSAGTNQVEPARSRGASRLRLFWDWYTDLGFGGWVLTGGVLIGLAFLVSLVVGHGDHPDSSCQVAQPYESLVDRYDGRVLTARQAARLHVAATRLQAAAESTAGHPRDVLSGAAQVAGAAQAGSRFDAGLTYGRFADACDFSSRPSGTGN
jgi:hypothetical protein